MFAHVLLTCVLCCHHREQHSLDALGRACVQSALDVAARQLWDRNGHGQPVSDALLLALGKVRVMPWTRTSGSRCIMFGCCSPRSSKLLPRITGQLYWQLML